MASFLLGTLLFASCALGSPFNSTYLRRHGKLQVCTAKAELLEIDSNDTSKVMTIKMGKCAVENMSFHLNSTMNTDGDFHVYNWDGSQVCGDETLDFAKMYCHHRNLSNTIYEIWRRNDRCYLDIGNSTIGKKCVFEQRGQWDLLDWLFPIAIVLAVFGFTLCCCCRGRFKKSSHPRGPILDTEPELPDAAYSRESPNDAYDARNSPFQ